MSKPEELENMQVVEIDAIDFGDWEGNMKTSELQMGQLRTLIRETAAQPIVAARPQPAPQTRVVAVAPAPTPAPPPATARPSLVPAPPPELPPLDEPSVDLRPRLPVPRWLLFAGSAVAGVLVMVVVIVMQQSSAPARAPQAAASSAAQPAADETPPAPAPAAALATRTATAPSITRKPPPAAPARAPSKPAVTPTTRASAAAPARVPALRPKSIRRVRPARKAVAVRAAPQATAPAPAMDAMERARAAYATGNEALFAGDSDAAIQAYLQVLELSPTFAFGQRGLGLAYAQKGDSAAAVKALREYLRLAPKAKDVPLIKKRIRALQTAKR